ncbi:MAG: YdeI/OmpD-associated family protein [Planctomycetaceae bacterium]|nr:YdeI/OmpD-associated family protein [Planctomycetaceae bacterium]
MPEVDSRVDAYIDNAAEFAQPILRHFRALVHQACPDVVETIKWGMPSFEYKGPYCSMVAFKKHCSFGFWKAALLDDGNSSSSDRGALKSMNWGAPGSDPLPAKISSLKDLPSKTSMLRLLKKAKRLNDEGIKVPHEILAKPKRAIPPDFNKALTAKAATKKRFAEMTEAQQRDYIEWIIGAKRPETRAQRIATAVAWVSEGKTRNWKYQKR